MKARVTYHYRGNIERPRAGSNRFHWHAGFSANSPEGRVLYPWMTKRECQADARAQGAVAAFEEKAAERIELLQWALGCVATELRGPHGALWGAQRKLNRLNHVAVGEGDIFECAKCGKRAHVEPVEGGFILRGEAATECEVPR